MGGAALSGFSVDGALGHSNMGYTDLVDPIEKVVLPKPEREAILGEIVLCADPVLTAQPIKYAGNQKLRKTVELFQSARTPRDLKAAFRKLHAMAKKGTLSRWCEHS